MSAEKTVKVTINGKEHQLPSGQNVVDAAESVGVEIPHYCYHPGLSVAGQCRMCYVEVPGQAKLQIACNMKCSEGLQVVTDSPKVKDAVKWSLEFHLINHPIDCPICDQAGECGLQNYYMEVGKYQSQMHEHKVNKQKVVELSDKIVLDKERCILCSRCVRFTEEVSKTRELGIYNRGDRSVIGTVNDEPFRDGYQVNTVDICPVGALTSKDFRFEQRVWFLKETESVCNGCSRGCNVNVHHKSGKHIYRLKPRYNEAVNSYWMCDDGRPTYKTANYDRRLTSAKLGGVELPIDEAIQNWVSDLKALVATERQDEVGIWLSPDLTNEETESIFKTFHEAFSIKQFFSEDVEAIIKNDRTVDQLLKRQDLHCNSAGFLKVSKSSKLKMQNTAQMIEALGKKKLSHLVIFFPEVSVDKSLMNHVQAQLTSDTFVCLITPQQEICNVFDNALCIPSISHYEKTGTIVNCNGLEQMIQSDFRMFKNAWSVQEILGRLSQEYFQRPRMQGAST